MSEYHCLVAGLPDIAFDGSKAAFSIDRFKEDIYPSLSVADAKCIDLFFLAWDNENLLGILREGIDAPILHTGCYSRNELVEIIDEVKNGDVHRKNVPAYIYDFLELYFEDEQQGERLWSDVLSAYYYSHAVASQNKFLSGWFEFNLNVSNLLVAFTARRHKMSVGDYVVGDNEVAVALRTSGARDFGLSGELDCFETVQHIADNEQLQERERQVDELRWAWLDDNSMFYYFTVERLFVFLQKLDIVARWASLDAEKGMQRYTELINNLKDGLRLSDI